MILAKLRKPSCSSSLVRHPPSGWPLDSSEASWFPNSCWRVLISFISVASLTWVTLWVAPTTSYAGLFSQPRQYGPTTPSGYTVRVEPQAATLSHSQRQPVQVTVEDETGKLVEGATVQFRASEGAVATSTHTTQGGIVTGTFATTSGGDHPRTAFIIVTVENVEITVFIDIVPAVFGR